MQNSLNTEHLVIEGESLAKEIDDALIAYASPDARMEWAALRARWPSAVGQHHTPAIAAEEDDLAIIVGKVRRFRAILGRGAASAAVSADPGE
jgi:hypothetical protein